VNSIGELNLHRSPSAVDRDTVATPTINTSIHASFIESRHRDDPFRFKIFRRRLQRRGPAPAESSLIIPLCPLWILPRPLLSAPAPRPSPGVRMPQVEPSGNDPLRSTASLPSPPRRRTP